MNDQIFLPDRGENIAAVVAHTFRICRIGDALSRAGAGLSAALESGSPDRWYWPAAATVEDGELRAFYSRYARTGSGPWGFRYLDSQLAQVSLPDLVVRRVTTLYAGSPVTWGSAILSDGAYTYVYGVEDRGLVKTLHVARAPRGGLLGPWELWTGMLGWGPGARRLHARSSRGYLQPDQRARAPAAAIC